MKMEAMRCVKKFSDCNHRVLYKKYFFEKAVTKITAFFELNHRNRFADGASLRHRYLNVVRLM
jgi:hypothetical protein